MSQLSTNKQRYTLIPTPFDGKRTNCYVSGSDVIIETIPEYLARVTSDIRDTFLVTVMLPKDGHSAGTFPIATFSTVLADFDFKLYGFVGGLADENFIEITFSSVESFLDLTDTPDSYTGQSKKFIRVKEDLSGLEFFPLETTSITIDVYQPSHSLSVGYPIRVSGTNTYVGAQANNEANAEVVGYVTEIVDGDNFKYVPIGEVTTGVPSVAAGTVLFLSPTVQGGLTSTEPTTVGQVSKPLMVVIESGAKALFINYRGMRITPEGEGGEGITDYPEIIKFDSGVTEGTDLYIFNGSVTKTINFKSGTNISFATASGEVTISADGGGGDVTGPLSAVDGNIAVYDSTTGKIIKDGGTKISDLATTSSLSGYVPTTTTVNGKALSSNISLSPSDIGSPSGSGTCSGTNTGDNAVNSLYSGLASSKQDTLVSTVNIKSVNGVSILGSGDLTITGAGGDVTGPSSSVDDDIVLFNGVSGKIIKDSGKKLSDYQPVGNYATGGGTATGTNTGDQDLSGLTSKLTCVSKTANYTANPNELINCDVSGGSFTITLPSAPADKTIIFVKLYVIGTNKYLTLKCGGTDKFNTTTGNTEIYMYLFGEFAQMQYCSSTGLWTTFISAGTFNFATNFPGVDATTPLTNANISIDTSTRVLTITPPLGYFNIFIDGGGVITRYRKVGNISFPAFTDTSGFWYFYFDTNGTAVTTQNPWSPNDFSSIVPIYRIVWNATLVGSAKLVRKIVEYHLNTISADDHRWYHLQGAQWVYGLNLFSNALPAGTPNADGRNAVIGLSTGAIVDDNLDYIVTNSTAGTDWTQDLGSNTPASLNATNSGLLPIRYTDGGGLLYTLPATRFPFDWNSSTNVPNYITAIGTRTPVSNNYYFTYFIYGIQDPSAGNALTLVSAPNEYASITEARAITWLDIQNIYPSLNDNEVRPLYRLIFQTKTSAYNAGTKYTALLETADLRKAIVTTTSTASGSIPASSVTVVPVGNISSTNTQSALAELDTEKASLSGATFTGAISATNLSGTNSGDQNIFSTIAVSGQSNVVADSTSDTLTLVAGTNITITTDASSGSVTINSTAGGSTGIWTSLSGTYASTTTFTFTGTDTDVKLITLSLLTCTDSAGTTRRIGYVKSAVNNSGTITATVVTNSDLASGDKDFKVTYNRKVTDYQRLITIPGGCTADTSYSQGMFYSDIMSDSYLLPVDTSVLTAAAGTGAALTYNVYKGTTTLFSSAPDMTTNTVLRAQRPTTNTISAGDNVSLRIMSCGGATNYAADFQAKLFIVPQNLFTSF